MPDIPALKRCIKERKNICQATHMMLAESFMVAEMLKSSQMEIDDVWFAADLFDNILVSHNNCRGHYARGDPKRNDNADKEAEELREATEWLRAERDDFKRKEKTTSDWLIGEMAGEEGLVRRAIEELDLDDDYEFED